MPVYNEDDDTDVPPSAWRAFRNQVRRGDGVLFATPEYNRSIPGVMKNAIDVGSRPGGASVWSGKPAAVLSVSPGSLGGFGADHHLRQCLTFLDMPVLLQPEAYLGRVASLIDGSSGSRRLSRHDACQDLRHSGRGRARAYHARGGRNTCDDRRVAVGMEGGADGVRLLVPDEQADEALEVLRDS